MAPSTGAKVGCTLKKKRKKNALPRVYRQVDDFILGSIMNERRAYSGLFSMYGNESLTLSSSAT